MNDFTLDGFEPAYLDLLRRGELERRVALALEELRDCVVCPRDCHINRLENEMKVCHTGRHAVISSAFPHFGEEDCVRGRNGSGAIFFGLCNLRCVFCQNWDISQRKKGWEANAEEIAATALDLQQRGCHNINFVTPEHVAPQVVEAVAIAARRGLRLPIIYNTSAYDSLRSLRLLDGIVDIYMPDFKFWSAESAKNLAKAKDYPEHARAAIVEMHRQVGPLEFDRDGLAKRGLLVRHLVMPGQTDEAAAIMNWLARDVSPDTYVNIMDQYRPDYEVGSVAEKGRSRGKVKHSLINRPVANRELDLAFQAARAAGLWRFDERGGPVRPLG